MMAASMDSLVIRLPCLNTRIKIMNLQNWFMGVVESASDPEGMGRVKVRCFGYHTPDRDILPTSDLPWVTPILPPTSASVGGAGQTSGLLEGSMVFGCFYDGNELQDAVILGVFPGGTMTEINYDPVKNVGFGSIGGTGRGIPFAADAFGNSGRSQGGVHASASGPYQNQQGFYADNYPAPTFVPGGSQERLLEIAKSQLGVQETSGNFGPGIQKYWQSVTDGTGRYGDFWCAAFTSWVIEQAGILPPEKLPGTAGAFLYRDWARRNPDVAVGRKNPRVVYAGDLVVFSFSHIGFAAEDSRGSTVLTIEGNTGGRSSSSREVAVQTRNLSSISDAISIKSTGLQPLGGGPDPYPVANQETASLTDPESIVNQAVGPDAGRGRVTVDPGTDPYENDRPDSNSLPVREQDPIIRNTTPLGGLFPAGLLETEENDD